MPDQRPAPAAVGSIRKTVGTATPRTPLETLWHLRTQHRALGLPITLPDDHVRTFVGRPRAR